MPDVRISDLRPDVDLVAAAEAGFLDGATGVFATAVAAKTEFFFAGSGNHLAPVDRDGTIYALAGFTDRLQVYTDFRNGIFHTS